MILMNHISVSDDHITIYNIITNKENNKFTKKSLQTCY